MRAISLSKEDYTWLDVCFDNILSYMAAIVYDNKHGRRYKYPDEYVCICLDESDEIFVAMLYPFTDKENDFVIKYWEHYNSIRTGRYQMNINALDEYRKLVIKLFEYLNCLGVELKGDETVEDILINMYPCDLSNYWIDYMRIRCRYVIKDDKEVDVNTFKYFNIGRRYNMVREYLKLKTAHE